MIYVFVAIDCGPLSNPTNGEVTTAKGTGVDATAVYTCNQGYECSGCQTKRTCLNTGQWNGTPATCKGRYCIYTIRNHKQIVHSLPIENENGVF